MIEMKKNKLKESSLRIAQGITKFITYPTLGNMTEDLQERLEKRVGEDWYNAKNATEASLGSNILSYMALGAAIGHQDPAASATGVIIGFAYGLLAECGPRQLISEDEAGASLPGYILTKPIELGIKAYEKLKPTNA